jgi:5-methylcytosine-specific restriction enzyme subunit McrC
VDVELTTYDDCTCLLPDEDARFLAEQLTGKLRISRSLEPGYYLLNPQQYAGIVALPSGGRLTIRPRVPTSNILYMLGVAYRFPAPFFVHLEKFQALDEVIEPVAEHFADLVDERIVGGLFRAYVDTDDNLRALRGRIDFPRDLATNSILRDRIYCRYSELTWDIPHNQIIRYVAYLLSGWPFRRRHLAQRLSVIFNRLEEVALRPFTALDAESFTYNRLNEPYRRLHHLCALFLDSSSLSEAAGGSEFRTFLLDMNALFEQFITQALLDRVRGPWSLIPQSRHFLDAEDRIHLRPDIVLRHRGRMGAVADCKYKRIAGQSEFINHDYYQVLAYCTALGVRRGALIYPKHEVALGDTIQVRGSDVAIERLTIDLSGTPSDLRGEVDLLSGSLFSDPGLAGDGALRHFYAPAHPARAM